ncbi:hypothetical protein [Blastococcus goldschmidtiae]|uniref:Lipoprotein n=1 Tax=Blastococcus goldschmidtiae TaxID=3075546 RepID=A0ABU2K6S2_9ACTN|nr:hypothetical protein [Blastococcus sp. DSM 46792]MDT0275892.1 hypothetical protein [Blastococcus sp. DSM 46792]
MAAPDARLTLVADEDPAAQAVSTSRALFESSPVAVLARADDRAGMLLAASAAVGLGVPMLVEAARGDDAELAEELDRLGAETVLAVGEADGPGTGEDSDDGPEVLVVPADAEAVAEATGLALDEAQTVAADGDVAAVAGLDPEGPAALEAEDADATDADATAAATQDAPDVDPLPEFPRADPLDGAVVLAGTDASPAAVATSRAAGALVQPTDGSTDPRASAGMVEALAAEGADAVIALGAGFAAEQGLDWKVETAATGTQLPGGGQLLFPGRMLIALYGHPGTGSLGVLGEQPLEAAIQRARDHAAAYDPFVDVPVVPAFEIIATVASTEAGADGDYSNEADIEMLRPWVEAAGAAGVYVVLDLQPGRTDFVTQAELYRPLLELPHVGLALDPEWRLGPNEVHLTQIGSVGVEEVNRVVTWLADLTRENALPQKLLVLHQFRVDMLPGREFLDMSRDELAIMIHADGQGGQGAKQSTWEVLHRGAQPELTWGWKNFYDEDLPMLTPQQTIEQVVPRPDLVTYQ